MTAPAIATLLVFAAFTCGAAAGVLVMHAAVPATRARAWTALGPRTRAALLRHARLALLAQFRRGTCLGEQTVQHRIVRGRMMLIAQKPDEPRAEPDPVGQEAPRQERLQFVNTRISHAGAGRLAAKRELRQGGLEAGLKARRSS